MNEWCAVRRLSWQNILRNGAHDLFILVMTVLTLWAFSACQAAPPAPVTPGPTPIPSPTPFRPDPNWVDTDVGRIYWFDMQNGDRCYMLRDVQERTSLDGGRGVGVGIGLSCVGSDAEVLAMLEEVLAEARIKQ